MEEFFGEVTRTGIERAAPVRTLVQKQSGGLFLARGRFPGFTDAVRRTVDGKSEKVPRDIAGLRLETP